MSNTSIELRAEREKNRLKMTEQVQANRDAGTPTSDDAWEKYNLEDQTLQAQIRDLEFSEANEKILADNQIERQEITPKDQLKKEKTYERAFLKSLFNIKMNDEEKRAYVEKRGTGNQTTTDSEGGEMIPTGFSNMLHEAKAQWGGMFGVSHIIQTATGNDWLWPKVDDTAATGKLVAEAAALTVQDIAFTNMTLGAYMYSSDIVKVSVQSEVDIAFIWSDILMPMFARRLGTIQNLHFTTGTGSGQPNGWVTASSSGKTAAAVAAVTRPELLDLEHSVNRAYRSKRNPSCGFMMNDATEAHIKSVSMATAASDNGPLWTPGLTEGAPDRIHGWPIFNNEDMASLAAGSKSIGFGDFSYYKIRRVANTTAVRLNELYMANLLKGYVAFERFDADLLDTSAIKYMTQAAS